MGAGIPAQVPRLLTDLAAGIPAAYRVTVAGADPDDDYAVGLDPAEVFGSPGAAAAPAALPSPSSPRTHLPPSSSKTPPPRPTGSWSRVRARAATTLRRVVASSGIRAANPCTGPVMRWTSTRWRPPGSRSGWPAGTPTPTGFAARLARARWGSRSAPRSPSARSRPSEPTSRAPSSARHSQATSRCAPIRTRRRVASRSRSWACRARSRRTRSTRSAHACATSGSCAPSTSGPMAPWIPVPERTRRLVRREGRQARGHRGTQVPLQRAARHGRPCPGARERPRSPDRHRRRRPCHRGALAGRRLGAMDGRDVIAHLLGAPLGRPATDRLRCRPNVLGRRVLGRSRLGRRRVFARLDLAGELQRMLCGQPRSSDPALPRRGLRHRRRAVASTLRRPAGT